MCGIAGLIAQRPEEKLPRMLSSIEHRGRDNEGLYVSDSFGPDSLKVALGHRRLAIIDTSSEGNQPFETEDGRFRITYNGELYNYLELRKELIEDGVRFETQSDTEVLLKAFQKWGIDSLKRFNGMFAFAIWDDLEKELTLARDRCGIKPLFFAKTDKALVFASEIKAIHSGGLVEKRLDQKALHEFLTFLWPVPPRTMFEGVEQLSPGHYAVWSKGNLKIKQWWDLDFSKEESGDEREWIERTELALRKATAYEMIADVNVGAFLSGGVDSSTIVALMSKLTNKPISAYTTAISDEDLEYDIVPNDVKWSRVVAEEFKLDYHEQLQNPDLETLLPKLVEYSDAPIVDMAVPTYLISESARKELKVMLSGMGGDEVFAGYPRHLAMKIAGYSDFIPTSVRRPLMSTVHSLVPGGRKGRLTAPLRNLKKFSKSASLDFEDRYLGFGTYFDEEMRRRIVVSDGVDEEFDPYETHRKLFKHAEEWSPLNRLLYVDFKTFMPSLNLDTTDRMSMANNLEVRVPFLNNEILHLSERLPAGLKLSGYTRKYVLKKAVEKHLPSEVIWRKKAGFSAPVRSWVRGKLDSMISELLSKEAVEKRGIFAPTEVDRILRRNESGAEDYNLQVFQLLTFEIFMRQHFGN